MTQKQASEVLNVSVSVLRSLIRNKKIKLNLDNKIIPESVYSLKEDLEERRKIDKPVWVKRNTY